jgi:hypothetical protein
VIVALRIQPPVPCVNTATRPMPSAHGMPTNARSLRMMGVPRESHDSQVGHVRVYDLR